MNIFRSNPARYDGMPAANFWALRVMFALIATMLAYQAWKAIVTHDGAWNPIEAAAWSFWAAFGIVGLIGAIKPQKVLTIVLLEIVYKVIWLAVVAVPVWFFGAPAGEGFEYVAASFVPIVLVIAAMPWKYFIASLGFGRVRQAATVADA